MKDIRISAELAEKCPLLHLLCIEAEVAVAESDAALLTETESCIRQLAATLRIEDISRLPAIAASRRAYKACGKDPARYRLSAEALLRRVVIGKGLYQINNVVDQLNLVSITTGFSIGGYDADRINGSVEFGIGHRDEPYTGLGRGALNIEGMPVFRDQEGAFGTPTSDSERTGVTATTRRFLMIIINYAGEAGLAEAGSLATRLLNDYCSAKNIEQYMVC